MYKLVADLETGDRSSSHAEAQPPAAGADENDSDESSSSCQLGNAGSNWHLTRLRAEMIATASSVSELSLRRTLIVPRFRGYDSITPGEF
ncbi:hypothetical protein KM043_011084 [Ampulex compressa]|nr:hypothetical protein KM043_011084 [Ampulex compressa]